MYLQRFATEGIRPSLTMKRLSLLTRLARDKLRGIHTETEEPSRRLLVEPAIEEERLPYYQSNQYFPIRLGDVLANRYHVVSKLGFGAYSTVWLCRDQKYVCVRSSDGWRLILLQTSFTPCRGKGIYLFRRLSPQSLSRIARVRGLVGFVIISSWWTYHPRSPGLFRAGGPERATSMLGTSTHAHVFARDDDTVWETGLG